MGNGIMAHGMGLARSASNDVYVMLRLAEGHDNEPSKHSRETAISKYSKVTFKYDRYAGLIA